MTIRTKSYSRSEVLKLFDEIRSDVETKNFLGLYIHLLTDRHSESLLLMGNVLHPHHKARIYQKMLEVIERSITDQIEADGELEVLKDILSMIQSRCSQVEGGNHEAS